MLRYTTAALVVCAATVGAAEVAPPPRPVDVPALVQQLGSPDLAVRDAAEARLSRLPAVPPELLAATRLYRLNLAPPELRPAVRAADLSVRARANAAAAAIRARVEPRDPTRSERFARRGRVDLYVAATAADRWDDDSPRAWEPPLALGKAAIDRYQAVSGRAGPVSWNCPVGRDFTSVRRHAPTFRLTAEQVRADDLPQFGGTVAAGADCRLGFSSHTLVSRGAVRAGEVQSSLVLANGDFDCPGGRYFSLAGVMVICDGDVRLGGNVYDSVIIARGSISIKGKGQNSANMLIAGGTVTIDKPPGPFVNPDTELMQKNYVTEKARQPLDYFSFFELSDLGMDLKAEGKVVTVSAVTPSGAAGEAGVKAGDVVAAVNGKAPDGPESLRRLLRDALAVGDAAVTLTRDGEAVKVALPLRE